jgi:hypothetical protein
VDEDQLNGRVIHRGDGDFIVGPPADVFPFEQPSFPFVKDRRGTIFLLEKVPNITSPEQVTLCGCGPPGRGVRQVVRHTPYRLPDGARFGGPMRVEYPAKEVWIVHAGTTADGRRCPQRP